MRVSRRSLTTGVGVVASLSLISRASLGEEGKRLHRVAFHVDENNANVMDLVLNNVENVTEYYEGVGQNVQIDVVAYGPGLVMFRADKSPEKARIAQIAKGDFASSVIFSACGNTLKKMEKAEGRTIKILPEAKIVPSGVVHLIELQEKGWSYIRT